MQCVECAGPLVSVLERSRKVCAACYLRHRFRVEQRPANQPTDALLREGDGANDEEARKKADGRGTRRQPRTG